MNISEVLSKANLQMRHFHRFQLEHDMEMTSQDDDLKNTEELDNLSQGLQIISKENQDKEQEEIQSKIKEVKNFISDLKRFAGCKRQSQCEEAGDNQRQTA